MLRNFLKLKAAILIVFLSVPTFVFGVSQKEMEQARTIAAKAYLRYANDGSGYLDDLNPTTMQELEASLKSKEKENIKAFKEIPVPSDYKDWDKEKLVDYWAVKAFQTKGLIEKGRGGRIRARSQINKMTIAPVKEEVAPMAAVTAEPVVAESPVPAEVPSETLEEIKADEQSILADEAAEEEDLSVGKASNYTWVYIMVLAILVGIVIALVVYAANVMKKNGNRGERAMAPQPQRNVNPETQSRLETVIADKDMEISMLKKKLEAATRQNSELRMKVENLTSEISFLKAGSSEVIPERQNVGEQEPLRETATGISKNGLRSIYLGRANSRGIFVRADRSLNPGNSVFMLETSDGFSGSFRVVDSQGVWDMALSNPQEYLMNACMGHFLDEPGNATRIITESPGTAVFEGGCWRVIRKARIRYE